MRKKMWLVKLFLGLVVFSFTVSTARAGPGYVTRDCLGALTKEAITLDWDNRSHYFYTVAALPRRSGSTYEWEYHYNSAHGLYEIPTNKRPVKSYVYTPKSHAGLFSSPSTVTSYYGGTYGIHYWYNFAGNRWENRRAWITDCNLSNRGKNNW